MGAEKPSVENLASQSRRPKLQDVKAEDYATPEKYLEGAEIPTFYQFQSNMVADEDLKPGMVSGLEVDKRLTLPTRTQSASWLLARMCSTASLFRHLVSKQMPHLAASTASTRSSSVRECFMANARSSVARSTA